MSARWLVVAALAVAGCKDKVAAPPSCKALTSTIAKIGECKLLPESTRSLIKRQVDNVNRALEQLESVEGGERAKQLVKTLDEMCTKQNESVRTMYAKTAPSCLE